MWSTISHWLGLDNASGHWYLFWSGVGSDISELAIVGALVGAYRQHTCHQRGCWRLSRHEITGDDGITYRVCRVHHPGAPREVTRGHVQQAWAEHSERVSA